MSPDDLASLAKSLDLPAKVRLLTGASAFTLHPEPAVGLGELRFSDGPTGVRGLKFAGGRVVSLFPNATLLASSWDPNVLYEVGTLLAEEAMAQQIHVVLGPTINLHRTALGGRLFEAYSEDPLLTGRLAAAYVRGLQDNGIAACLKHLVANESETDRNTVDSVVDEATLRELYLLPFEIAALEGEAWSMMAAYNDVNGVAATEQNHVINEVVKGEWGYSGLVMSDWFATKSAAPAANGGLDLVMPGPAGPWGEALVAAVHDGLVAKAVIDDHLSRLLLLARRVGALADPRSWPSSLPNPDSAVRREQLTRLAAAGMTVLKNEGDVLPLDRAGRVALIGRHAVETIDMGGGSAQVNPPHQVSVATGLTALLGAPAVSIVDGVEVRTRPVPSRFLTDPVSGAQGIRATLYDAAGSVLEDRLCPQSKTMVGMDDDFAGPVASARLSGRVGAEGPVELGVLGVGEWTVRVDGASPLTFPLQAAGNGFGEEVLTPPLRTDRFTVAPGALFEATVTLTTPMGLFGLIGHNAPRATVDVIDDAVRAAAAADVAVVVVGLTEEQETESVDKSTLRLPGAQDALVEAVAGAARRTVVVVNAATPVLMPWLSRVDAVLWAGLPGQEGGHAIAAALLGDVEPAGRLVTTFPAADGAAPAWSVTPVDGKLPYAEGTFIGYRGHYAGRAPEPAFWMGHGLGYGRWEYSDVRLVTGDEPAITATVENVGGRRSREVVQVYLRPVEPDEPIRLVGWSAVTVDPGQSARVTVRTDPRLWRRWDEATGSWGRLSEGGTFLVARGLGDIRATVG
ncbi:glycoside hydrolase family 3 C-terminal domain-containing protein [Actinoplanes sp. KI2]|uniref:beta-glucosidase family protein n=1 Tax=Actinoplanes sp. KI2 TaxID=2983315 RepID=UPI0021D58866|nr:glycoside hydrolase family 3 C-terminal domain-containing protein [Actinoplanes sp. KI2]MCU7728707.1 glycoside hydrolase family 3 C-terminal domain-containing protein [Actinoplanes sp. KI2]